jgi:hypothetical protein
MTQLLKLGVGFQHMRSPGWLSTLLGFPKNHDSHRLNPLSPSIPSALVVAALVGLVIFLAGCRQLRWERRGFVWCERCRAYAPRGHFNPHPPPGSATFTKSSVVQSRQVNLQGAKRPFVSVLSASVHTATETSGDCRAA